MLEIIALAVGIYLLLLVVGRGVFELLVDDQAIRAYSFFLSPWFGVCMIAILGVWTSMLGLTMDQSSWLILAVGGILTSYTLIKKKVVKINISEQLLIGLLLIIGLGFNLYPLLTKVGFATTISLSNLDPISYSTVADYLRTHTVLDGSDYVPFSPTSWSIGDLLHYSYRWGSPLLLSFFSSLLVLPAFKIYSVLLNLLFAMSFPVVYVLARYLFNYKLQFSSLLIIFFTYFLNSTLLYMLYNVFFAQFVFSGVFISSMLIFLMSVKRFKFKNWKIYPSDIALGIVLSATSSLYPEGLFLMLLPIFTWMVIKIFQKKSLVYLKTFKILILGILLNPRTMFTAIRQLIKVIISSSQATTIGWEMIRSANPMELLGLYNLYYSRPLPELIAIALGLIFILMWTIGFVQIKQKIAVSAYLIVFLMTYFTTRVVGQNFFTYHRSLTYTLFIYIILFTVFFDSFVRFFRSTKAKALFVVLVGVLSFRSAYRTLYQFYWHHEAIDKSLISLQALNQSNIKQTFYTADVFMGEYHLWNRLWQEYFLTNQKIVSKQNFTTDEKLISGPLPVLAEKKVLEKNGVKLVYQDKIWENDYYILGHLVSEAYDENKLNR